jgi:tetratricopeptide (TPR) repeat protein
LWSLRLGLAKSEQALAYRIRTSQPQEAEKIYRQVLELLEKLLAQSPANAHVRQQMCIAMESLAAHLQQVGRDEAAAELTGRAQTIVEKLVLDFPQASDYRERFAKGYAAQAQRLLETQPQQAEQAYRRALTIQQQLVLDFPGQPRFADDVVVTQRRLLDLLRTANGPQGLIDLQRQMLAHSQRVAQQSPDVLTYHREVAKNHNRLGLLLREAGQSAAAEVELLKAQEVWRGRFSPKVEKALKAAEADSKNVHRWHDLFLAYHGNGEWEKCLWAIKKKQEHCAPSVWEWFHESMVLWQLNQRDEAHAKFHAALDAMERDDSRLGQLRGYQSEAAMLLGLPDPGLRVDRANDYSKQAGALEKAGQTAQAKEAYAQAIEAYESLAADFPLAQSYTRKLAGLLTKAGRSQEIEPAYRRAIAGIEELEQASPELRLAQANYHNDLATLLNSGQRLTEAEEAVRRAVALKQDLVRDFPGRPELPFHLAHSYLGLCYVLQAAQQTSVAAEALGQADDLLQKLADDLAARKLLRERLGHTLWKAADSWLGMNRLDEARQSNQQALLCFGQLAAEFPATHFFRQEQAFSHRRLADVAERAKQPEKIEEHLQLAAGIYAQLMAEVPGSDFYRHEAAAVYVRLGNLLLPSEKRQEAEAEYTKAIHLSPQAGAAWSGRAYAHFHRQQWEQAAADFSKAIELTPNVHGNWWHRGHSYLHMQQWDQAAADFGKSVETWPDGGEGWYLRAIARAQMNQPDQALADLRQALAKGYLRLEQLKNEPKLEPLHKTADFGKLLEELQRKVKLESK